MQWRPKRTILLYANGANNNAEWVLMLEEAQETGSRASFHKSGGQISRGDVAAKKAISAGKLVEGPESGAIPKSFG